MSEPIKASPAFVSAFQAVCRHYKCTPDEIEIMKQLARADMPAAVQSFGIMAGEVAA